MFRKIFIGFLLILLTVSYSRGIRGIIHESDKGGRLVPKMLNYQGYLTDTEGIPIDANLNMKFRIYDVETGGTELWGEDTMNVSVERGVFNALLGSVDTIPHSVFTTGTDRWLELILNVSDTLSPRTRITAMGYAYMATHADTAKYAQAGPGVADADWDISGNLLYPSAEYGLSMRSTNVLYGTNDSTHVNFGVACTTGTSAQNYKYCTVAGGYVNAASGNYSFVGGGLLNKAGGDYSFAAGRQAKANHSGSFVWADDEGVDFTTTGDDQFLIRAAGNVGIGTNSPDYKLDVVGTVQMDGFKMTASPTSGYVLTSDANGVGTWQPVGGELAGVSMVAIQELTQLINEQQERIEILEKKIEKLENGSR